MSLLNKKAVKQFYAAHNKQLSSKAVDALEARVYAIMRQSVNLTPGTFRVTDTEVYYAKG